MAKLVLNDLQNLTNKVTAVNAINNNNARIEEAMENTLSRDGTGPNEMEASLDMNDFPIYNLPKATSPTEPVRKQEFDQLEIAGDVEAFTQAVEDAQAASAAAVAAAEIAVDAAASINLPPVVANTMLVANPAGTARENKTFPEVSVLLGISGGSGIYYNAVTDGGVDNTGATDCSADIEAAVVAAKAAGKTLYFPKGIYEVLSGSVDISADDVSILAEGRDAIFRRSQSVALPIFSVTGRRFKMHGGWFFYSPGTWPVSGAHTAIYLQGREAELYNIYVSGLFYVGIYTISSSRIVDCTVKGVVNRAFYFATQVGVVNNHVYFTRCIADGAVADGGTTPFTSYGFNTNGFGTGSAQGLFFTDCQASFIAGHCYGLSERILFQSLVGCMAVDSPAAPGFLVQKANGFSAERIRLSNCLSLRCNIGFYATESNFVSFVGCHASINTSHGFLMNTVSSGLFNSCISENNAGYGFITDATCNNISVSNCISPSNSLGAYSLLGTPIATVGNL